jgi:hypothetical protein
MEEFPIATESKITMSNEYIPTDGPNKPNDDNIVANGYIFSPQNAIEQNYQSSKEPEDYYRSASKEQYFSEKKDNNTNYYVESP